MRHTDWRRTDGVAEVTLLLYGRELWARDNGRTPSFRDAPPPSLGGDPAVAVENGYAWGGKLLARAGAPPVPPEVAWSGERIGECRRLAVDDALERWRKLHHRRPRVASTDAIERAAAVLLAEIASAPARINGRRPASHAVQGAG